LLGRVVVGPIPFIRHPDPGLPEALAGEVWDLEAFPAGWADERNALDGGRWTYWLWPRAGDVYGEPATVSVEVARRAEVRIILDVKKILYHRLRYHGESRGVFVALQEHLHTEKPFPQALIKARYALAERAMGDVDGVSTFRAVGEILLLADTPGKRDELAMYVTMRLLSDLPLLEALGWDGLTLSRADRMLDLGDAVLYGAELTLEGAVDAYVAYDPPYRIGEYDLLWRIPL
ncbi:hypothetical protein, partial [Thermus scotoductus]|uniref:hypothetical protein n=1 Tax=Thermus scotoductus TaxID=37636 RepID=UPI00156241D9